jgi:hypothetical protein
METRDISDLPRNSISRLFEYFHQHAGTLLQSIFHHGVDRNKLPQGSDGHILTNSKVRSSMAMKFNGITVQTANEQIK